MGLYYGTAVRFRENIEAFADAAIARHSHYYTDAPGWLIRAEAVRYAAIAPYADPVGGDGEWYVTDAKIELFAFPVKKWTPTGATIIDIWNTGRPKFVSLSNPHKQWASRTSREAIQQLGLRRKRQQHILRRKLSRAKEEADLCEVMLTGRSLLDLKLDRKTKETNK